MKKIATLILIFTIILSGLNAQNNCGIIVEMKGTGMHYEDTAYTEKSLTFDDVSTIDSIVVEAVYKSDIVPEGTINFTSPVESVDVNPIALDYFTKPELDSYNPNVFRATMQPAESITLNNNINNPDGIWSFAAYVYRSAEENKMSMIVGEHAYYYVNSMENPGIQYISLPEADAPRDITINMGITELNNDTRVGYFIFTAGEYEELLELNTYDPELGISYAVEEITLPDIPGDITQMVVTGFSPDEWVEENNMYNGDSYIGGRMVLTIECTPEEPKEPKPLCTYTQGFYGNAGGKTCQGLTTTELLTELLDTDLVIGGGDNTLTIAAGHIECVYNRLPGGGPSATLDGHATCEDPVGIVLHKKGTFKNTLLAQTITLALNFRMSPDLNDVVLDQTMKIGDIGNCMDPVPKVINGSERDFHISSSVVDYLGEGATLGQILELANLALSGEDVSPLSLSEIGDTVAAINEGFDECKALITCNSNEDNQECIGDCEENIENYGSDEESNDDGQYTENGEGDCNCDCNCNEDQGDDEGNDEGDNKGDAGDEEGNPDNMQSQGSNSNIESQIYPNPVISTAIVELTADQDDIAYVAVYDLSGKELFVLFNDDIHARQVYKLDMPVDEIRTGIYILKIITSGSIETKAFSVAR